jgi:broad specificity phosphatase PhoE
VSRLTVIAAVGLIALATAAPSPVPQGKGLILLVRHAERVQSPTNDDPPLTDAGTARAQRLATMLATSDIRAIYITRFQRTRATAKPVADLLHLTPTEESDTDQLIAKLRARGSDDNVLVVGHSDTVPDVIKAFGGPTVTIGDDDFDDLFVLSPATGALTRLAY